MFRYERSTHAYNLWVQFSFHAFPFSSILIHASRGLAILFQAILFGLTIYKFILAIRDGWGDVPLIVLLSRDGAWAFCLLFCMSFFLARPGFYAILIAHLVSSSVSYAGHLGLYALNNSAYAGVLFGWVFFIEFALVLSLIYVSRWVLTIFSFCVSTTQPTKEYKIKSAKLFLTNSLSIIGVSYPP
jgi:hypothetical protein